MLKHIFQIYNTYIYIYIIIYKEKNWTVLASLHITRKHEIYNLKYKNCNNKNTETIKKSAASLAVG